MRTRASWPSYDRLAKSGEYGSVLADDGTMSAHNSDLADHFTEAVGGMGNVLDLGCGTGFPGLLVASHVGRVFAVDASEWMLRCAMESADRLGLTNWHPIRALGDPLPLPDKSADAMTMSGFLGSIEHPERVLEEIRRVAKPDAVIATLDQDFGARLADGIPSTSWTLTSDGDDLLVRRCSFHTDPDRIETAVKQIRPGVRPRSSAEELWTSLPMDDILDEWVEIERQWRPDTLRALFEASGFDLRRQETLSIGMPLMFSVFERI